MAVAKLVCGDCGEELSPSDVRCPSCGASIEREESPSAPAVSAAPVVCASCGQANPPGSEFCRSCGARLADRSSGRRGKTKRPAPPPPKREQRPGAGVGVWQIISLVAVVALLSYVAYTLIRGEKSPPPVADAGMPTGGAPLSGVGLQSVDLKPLEDAVRENPADPAAQLRLANALHDNRALPRAIEAYRRYLTMRPKDPDARTDLGICYFQSAQSDSINRESLLREAASLMEEAFKNAPRPHQPSAFNLGVVYLHLSDLETADRWFKKAVEINPESDLGKRAQNMITQHAVPQ